MQSLAIVLMSIAAAVGYGILHDQITVRICVEYFSAFLADLRAHSASYFVGFAGGIVVICSVLRSRYHDLKSELHCDLARKATPTSIWFLETAPQIIYSPKRFSLKTEMLL